MYKFIALFSSGKALKEMNTIYTETLEMEKEDRKLLIYQTHSPKSETCDYMRQP